MVTENPDGRSVTIEWTMRKTVSDNETVLFAIQGRNNTGQHPSKRLMTDWIDMAIVSQTKGCDVAKEGLQVFTKITGLRNFSSVHSN